MRVSAFVDTAPETGARRRAKALHVLASKQLAHAEPIDRLTPFQKIRHSRRTLTRIFEIVTAQFGLSKKEILGLDRHKMHSLARKVTFYLALRMSGLSSVVLGREFNRDHTTLLSARDSCLLEMDGDAALAEFVERTLETLEREILGEIAKEEVG